MLREARGGKGRRLTARGPRDGASCRRRGGAARLRECVGGPCPADSSFLFHLRTRAGAPRPRISTIWPGPLRAAATRLRACQVCAAGRKERGARGLASARYVALLLCGGGGPAHTRPVRADSHATRTPALPAPSASTKRQQPRQAAGLGGGEAPCVPCRVPPLPTPRWCRHSSLSPAGGPASAPGRADQGTRSVPAARREECSLCVWCAREGKGGGRERETITVTRHCLSLSLSTAHFRPIPSHF